MPFLIIKKVLGTLAMYYLKKHAAALAVDLFIEGADKLAKMSETQFDDKEVEKLRADRAELIKIINSLV